MSSITTSMFESIRTALNKTTNVAKNNQILRCEPGNTYTVRLLPNIDDPSKTFFHYYTFGWNSFSTGQYVSVVSPSTFGAKDPIAEARYKILRTGTQEEKDKARAIIRSEKWLVNAYIINDPVNEENNGKVMILRYGKQLHKIIMDAIEGEGSEDLGPRIFDLSEKGSSLKIKVEQQGDYPTYVSSKFMMPKAIEGFDASKTEKINKSVYDLESVFTVKSYEEIKQLFNEHYVGSTDEVQPAVKPSTQKAEQPKAVQTPKEEDLLEDDTVKKLLEGLDADE
jgi:hypothetical protein